MGCKGYLKRLRREAGYRSAKEFAEAIGVPCPTYSRWEQRPGNIPMAKAVMVADALGASLDVVAERKPVDEPERRDPLRESYESLSPVSRAMFDEYLIYLMYREGRL